MHEFHKTKVKKCLCGKRQVLSKFAGTEKCSSCRGLKKELSKSPMAIYERKRRARLGVNTKYDDNKRFGGNKKFVLERDCHTCCDCGMTNEQHMKKYNRSITVDHINGLGRNSIVKDNSLENLITKCFSCHMKKDGRVRHT